MFKTRLFFLSLPILFAIVSCCNFHHKSHRQQSPKGLTHNQIGFIFGNICNANDTTVTQSDYKSKQFCDEQLVFEDNFDTFNLETWKHENTLRGGGNWEFQYYGPDPTNSYVKDGYLNIHPSLTEDDYEDKKFVEFGTISLGENCTDGRDYGCERTGSYTNVLNPVKSASLNTQKSFNFKYGRMEVRAKMPRGDWLWPSIVLLPKNNTYGDWPASGQLVVVESRGNRNLTQNGENIGVEQVRSAVVAGVNAQTNIITPMFETRGKNFHREFHRYQMEWTPDSIKFKIDNNLVGQVDAKEGFYREGNYESQNIPNPWFDRSLLAPFDQEFYLQIQLAVGGVSKYFPDVDDSIENPGGKPWRNDSPQAATDFWTYRNSWLDEWDLKKGSTGSNFMIDYVRVWSWR